MQSATNGAGASRRCIVGHAKLRVEKKSEALRRCEGEKMHCEGWDQSTCSPLCIFDALPYGSHDEQTVPLFEYGREVHAFSDGINSGVRFACNIRDVTCNGNGTEMV